MEDQELISLLAILRAKNIGNMQAKRLLSLCGSATAVFLEKDRLLAKIPGLGKLRLFSLRDPDNFKQAELELAFIKKQKIKILFYQDIEYPVFLKQCQDAPVLLFQKGQVSFNHSKIISVVGTRQMTPYGQKALEKLFDELKEYDPVIISGLAYGVDIYAHKMAIKNKLQTLAILAHGLDMIYPYTHKKYAEQITLNGGLLSEFWSGTQPERPNFVKRNRIVAGISKATLVIESAERGGSLITAQLANSYNRDVFAVPGRLTDEFSAGCNHLLKTNRAAVLTSAKDLAYILNWKKDQKTRSPKQGQLFALLEPLEQKVFDYLSREGSQHLDIIALHCNLPIYKAASVLLNLELAGHLRPLPGKYFELN